LPELGSSEQTESGLDAQLSDTAATLSEIAAAPLVQATESLEQTAGNALEPARTTQLLPATVETLAVVTESVVAPVAETLPALEPVLETTAPLSRALQGTPATDAPSTPGAAPEKTASAGTGDEVSMAAVVLDLPIASAPTSIDRDKRTVPTRRVARVSPTGSGLNGVPTLPDLPGAAENTTSTSGGAEASPPPPSTPPPFAPGGPLSGLASAFASAGAGALVLLLAALAAAPILAVPGLGRRLRLTLAPWPQPILQLSLERPG
jgi:hypothetical protein